MLNTCYFNARVSIFRLHSNMSVDRSIAHSAAWCTVPPLSPSFENGHSIPSRGRQRRRRLFSYERIDALTAPKDASETATAAVQRALFVRWLLTLLLRE